MSDAGSMVYEEGGVVGLLSPFTNLVVELRYALLERFNALFSTTVFRIVILR